MTRKVGKTQHEKVADDFVILRDRMLEAALPHVPFDGWSERALQAGEDAPGLGA